MAKYQVVACKTVKSDKTGKVYYAPTVVLPDGDTYQFFGDKEYHSGDTIETTTRKWTIEGRTYLIEVIKNA